jgi:hypothetical protein
MMPTGRLDAFSDGAFSIVTMLLALNPRRRTPLAIPLSLPAPCRCGWSARHVSRTDQRALRVVAGVRRAAPRQSPALPEEREMLQCDR